MVCWVKEDPVSKVSLLGQRRLYLCVEIVLNEVVLSIYGKVSRNILHLYDSLHPRSEDG